MSEPRLAPAERAALLAVARAAILHHLGLAPAPALPADGPLAAPRGAFVTLHVGGALRGCIGTFAADAPLARTVAIMAVRAAAEDPRFPPIRADELGELAVSVSALGPVRPLPDRAALQVGAHGLLVRQDWHRGALLPKVAVEHGWDGEEFLKHACLKAGLPARAYLDPATVVEVFEAEEFGP